MPTMSSMVLSDFIITGFAAKRNVLRQFFLLCQQRRHCNLQAAQVPFANNPLTASRCVEQARLGILGILGILLLAYDGQTRRTN